MNHAKLVGYIHLDVFDQWESHFNVLHPFPLEFLNLSQPCDMGVEGVDRESDQFGVQFLEFVDHARECHELGGAHWGKIGRMAEQNDPFSFIVFREVDDTLCGGSGERGCGIANQWHRISL